MLSLVALPLIVASTREGLNSIPRHVREASYAVGKTKAATTRRILLPACRPQVATGAMLGLGRIIGDTAIIVVLLGATQNFAPVEDVGFPFNYLRGAGTTLTNFVYEASPTGQPQSAAESLCGSFRPVADGLGPERGRRRRPSPRKKGRNVEFLKLPRRRFGDSSWRTLPRPARSRRRPHAGTERQRLPRRRAGSPAPGARSAPPSSRSAAWRSTTSPSPTPIAMRSKASRCRSARARCCR